MSDGLIDVVIVEDDPLAAQINGHAVRCCPGFRLAASFCDGGELLAYLDRHKADLILLDLYLPHVDGLEAVFALRLRRVGVDYIVLSSDNDPSTIREALRLGAFDYLVKPCSAERLRRSLQSYRRYRETLEERTGGLSQEDLDGLRSSESLGETLPKGLHALTLKAVEDCLADASSPLSASDIAEALALSRVTARRYLEFLQREGRAELRLDRSGGGRPAHLFVARTERKSEP
ncbi:MAG: response regulator [Synergistales bacterium]|nr:response regulator [Synergistales bacterium]